MSSSELIWDLIFIILQLINSKSNQISPIEPAGRLTTSECNVPCPCWYNEPMTKVVFMGSPEFALPTLTALAGQYEVVGVVTQPDRASGRGRERRPPPVKMLALELGMPVMQPEKLRLPEAMEQLRAWAPELIVVAAFGQILKRDVLDLPHYGCINVHASL